MEEEQKESENTCMYNRLLLTTHRKSHVSYFYKYPLPWPLLLEMWLIHLLHDNMYVNAARGLDKA